MFVCPLRPWEPPDIQYKQVNMLLQVRDSSQTTNSFLLRGTLGGHKDFQVKRQVPWLTIHATIWAHAK